MKKGLVLEGGAMRGMFTCGVIDVFMENNIEFDGAIGVSAGAAFGCNIKSKQIGRPVRYNKKYCRDKRYSGFKHWIITGDYFNIDFCYGEMIYRLDPWDSQTFNENPMKFYCVVTNIETGKAEYPLLINGDKKDVDWIQASASMPVFSNPVCINGKKYLDGGLSDSIPLEFMEQQDYDRIVVVETQPSSYLKEKQKYLWFIRKFYRKYPNLIHTIENRYIHYNEQKKYIRDKEENRDIFVIRPSQSLNIKSTNKDPNELERVYQEGRKAAFLALDSLNTYLKS